MPTDEQSQALYNAIKNVVDAGDSVESGWLALKARIFTEALPADAASTLHAVFFVGAQHVFNCLSVIFDSGNGLWTDAERIAHLHAIRKELDGVMMPVNNQPAPPAAPLNGTRKLDLASPQPRRTRR